MAYPPDISARKVCDRVRALAYGPRSHGHGRVIDQRLELAVVWVCGFEGCSAKDVASNNEWTVGQAAYALNIGIDRGLLRRRLNRECEKPTKRHRPNEWRYWITETGDDMAGAMLTREGIL